MSQVVSGRAHAWVLTVAVATLFAACSGGGAGGTGFESNTDNARDPDGGPVPGNAGCEPSTCEDLALNCGPVADGCGGIVDCGECGDAEVCGLNDPNVCGSISSVCNVPTPACGDRECGVIGDGCDGTVDCGQCPDGQVCGLESPFACAVPPTSDPFDCPALIADCASVGAQCGKIGNGCGAVLDCDAETGGCGDGQVCGLRAPNTCAPQPACTPRAPAAACAEGCGMVSDGCGGLIDCEAEGEGCPIGQACGGAGVAGECGEPGDGPCTPFEPAALCTGKCGLLGDGCGGVLDCEAPGNGGAACAVGAVCGGEVPNQCAPTTCTPLDEAAACAAGVCGMVSDGCGGSIDCGGCGGDGLCGLRLPNQCDQAACVPLDPATVCAGKCGHVGDGCGRAIDCEAAGNGGVSCAGDAFCGGGGVANECGRPDCSEATCADLGFTCGLAPDGCGGVLDCGGADVCGPLATCQGVPATCVSGGGDGGECPLCAFIPACEAGSPTAITGRVTSPDGEVGIPNAIVYILEDNAAVLPDIGEGVAGGACERCTDEVLGPVLASALTDYTGAFRIEHNVPVGTDFTLVTKAGKWRRAATVAAGSVGACSETPLDSSLSRLPAHSSDGRGAHLPKMAISTGRVDEIECVFYKLGFAPSEFTVPSEDGRFHMFRANGTRMGSGCSCDSKCVHPGGEEWRCWDHDNESDCLADRDGCEWGQDNVGACDSDTSVPDSQLWGSTETLDAYDMVVLDCEGHLENHNEADPNVREYANKGGRVFASHWSFGWLYDNHDGDDVASDAWQTGLSQSGTWNPYFRGEDDDTAYLSLGRSGANENKIQTFARWLDHEDAATVAYDGAGAATAGQFPVREPRDQCRGVHPGSDEWVYRTMNDAEDRPHPVADTSVQQFSFNTPFGADADNVCGRVAYSGFHVSGAKNSDDDDYFPCVCEGDTLTPQEKNLVYMLFDLAACISTDGPPPPPSCTAADPATACAGKCGLVADGCGGLIDCGDTCAAGHVCDGSTCVPSCSTLGCADVGANCGLISNGCGGTVDCGDCTDGQVCGLSQPNVCGQPVCVPSDEAEACAGKCGVVADGCGGLHDCGGCPDGQVCGARAPNECGSGVCAPRSCEAQGIECGAAGDGCGGSVECGGCPEPGERCGGAGVPSTCGRPDCDPLGCEDLGAECGFIGDGCGGSLDCGVCPGGAVCGGAGPNKCGGVCTPTTCDAAAAECGSIGDGCGGVLDCGDCPDGELCGATGANQCGEGPACTPLTCESQGAECGPVGDGCGGVLDCGDCTAPESCGGAGEPNVCGKGDVSCTPRSCASQGAECGALGDGCGGLLDCGGCPIGQVCGILGVPNQCGLLPI